MRPNRTFTRIFASICSLALLSATIGCHSFKAPPTYPMEDPTYKPAGVSREGLSVDPPVPLVLLPGDTVLVRTISSESFTYEGLVIDGEGKVHVPIAGPVEVSGLSPSQAEKKIEEVLQKYDRFVRVSVIVTGWGGHTATVIGAVVSEGQKPISPGMRLAELIAAAGGPMRANTESGELNYIADLDAARLVRNGVPMPVSVRSALEGDPKHNVLIHPGDQLFMPAALGSRIAVLGVTGSGGAMLIYRPGMRLTEALAVAGGFTLDSDDEDVRIIRGPLKDPIVYRYDFDALVSGNAGDVELAPGDVVFVTEHWSANVGEVVNRVAPLLTTLIAALNTYLVIYTLRQSEENNNQVTAPPTTTGDGN